MCVPGRRGGLQRQGAVHVGLRLSDHQRSGPAGHAPLLHRHALLRVRLRGLVAREYDGPTPGPRSVIKPDGDTF